MWMFPHHLIEHIGAKNVLYIFNTTLKLTTAKDKLNINNFTHNIELLNETKFFCSRDIETDIVVRDNNGNINFKYQLSFTITKLFQYSSKTSTEYRTERLIERKFQHIISFSREKIKEIYS